MAKDIAEKINGKLLSISSAIKKGNVRLKSDVIGIVFPVYYATNDCGIPLVVARFVEKLESLGSKYIFAVCTHGGMAGTTIENLRNAIETRGGKLAAGFTLRMNNKKISNRKQQEMRLERIKKVKTICQYVMAQKRGRFETRGLLLKILMTPLRQFEKPIFMYRYKRLSNTSKNSFNDLVPIADRSFQTNEKCTGCGICARICPVNNIEIIKGKPVWLHHCETCYGCYGWCPNNAITGDIVSYNQRYHNPEVCLSEMLKQSEECAS